ncbi:MAG: hypothetical protein Q8Q04_03635 [archaeon]|nr:hypothetical protein [archaeon]
MADKNYLERLAEHYELLNKMARFNKMRLDNLPQMKSIYPEEDIPNYVARVEPANLLAAYTTALSNLNALFPELKDYIEKQKQEKK